MELRHMPVTVPQDNENPPDNGDTEQTEWDSLSVHAETKHRFASLRRQVEAVRDEDMTQDDALRWLLNNAPDPVEEQITASKKDDE